MNDNAPCMEILVKKMVNDPNFDWSIGREGLRKFQDMIYICDGHSHRVTKRPKLFECTSLQ